MPADPKIIERYGKKWEVGFDDLTIELACFMHRWGNGRLYHFKQVVARCWPDRVWHDWTERRIEGLAAYDFVSWTGCAAGGKTDDAALYAMVWWLCDPINSTVILTSTTGKMIRKRAWPAIQRLFHAFCKESPKVGAKKYKFPGDLIDSDMTLRASFEDGRRDNKSAIFAKAVKDGNTSKAAADIQGVHNRRILVIIDEATETPEAIFDVLPNLMSGTVEFQCLVLGNPVSRMDQHGKFSEPLKGWGAVGLDDDEWETVMQLNGKPGLCQRFDGEKSPNVLDPRPEIRFLLGRQELAGKKAKLGEKDPRYWQYARGFWPPSGVCNTVMDELDIIKHGGTKTVTFTSRRTPVAGLDPGFGGDDCVLVLGAVGDTDGVSGLVLQVEKEVIIHVDATKTDPIDYQIAQQTIDECKAYGVQPENFASDATGTGRGVFAILYKEWSPRIKRVEFGGMASDIPAGEDDRRASREVYDRRVTELWFSARSLLRAGRLKGLPDTAVREFTMREYDTRGGRYRLQTKDEMRDKYGRSPDHADAVVVLIDGIRKSGYVGRNLATDADNGEAWKKQVELANRVYETVDYSEEVNAA